MDFTGTERKPDADAGPSFLCHTPKCKHAWSCREGNSPLMAQAVHQPDPELKSDLTI
jgi:hypothetical protein